MAIPVVVITGALTGIGRATALAYARQGANVVVSGRRQEEGQRLAKELEGLGAHAEFVEVDVRFDEQVRALMDRAVQRFGRIDVALNNAGTDGQLGPVTGITDEAYAGTFDANVKGVILSLKHEFRVMQQQAGGGSIVNVASVYGQIGLANSLLYVGSKHAVIGITKGAALEGAPHGIRVNAVAPGYTQTAMYERVSGTDEVRGAIASIIPMRRAAEPEEIADAVIHLGSNSSSYTTGQTLTVDGGLLAGWPPSPGA
ncbi:SDR family NAD(P)-dependent oxidoreductase [Streptomyces sp. SID1121]|uniref:SDR family NAD(P)-dependent oxidoreductase n=1 Tax=Streptomyces sp. SID1121 TaxID=3425888 RepID=UPI00405651C0